jgi:hypothetical protein
VKHYRGSIKEASKKIASIDEKLSYYLYHYVSATPEDIEKDPQILPKKDGWNPLEWRFARLGITRLAVLFPLLIFVFWLLIAIILLVQKL